MAVSALDGIMAMHGSVLVFALPLWIVGHTHAPRWLVGTSVLVSTIMVVILQVGTRRGIDSNASATRAWHRAGWAFLAALPRP
ncbi:hypothetical protein GCM10010433_33500 [Streptomyces pulveraceus]|uniref:Uncharacterized protein n=1 Tax=Streptomyces pulveraceus TaxID=68258 RepID=A0ABW1GVG3_9ACTN